jgi:hypothetical protein
MPRQILKRKRWFLQAMDLLKGMIGNLIISLAKKLIITPYQWSKILIDISQDLWYIVCLEGGG